MFCYISHSKDKQFSNKFFEKFFCLANYIIIFLQVTFPRTMKTATLTSILYMFPVLVPGVVPQLKVSQSTGQDLVGFQVHPSDLPRQFQQSLKLDNYYQAYHSSKSPLGTSSPWAQGLVSFYSQVLIYIPYTNFRTKIVTE